MAEPNHNMDDIERLMYLEARVRYQDEIKNVQRQVQQHAQKWIDKKMEYEKEYARLSSLLKHCATRRALDAKGIIDTEQALSTSSHIEAISSKISTEKCPTMLDERVLEDCKEQLLLDHRARTLLTKEQCNLSKNRETLRSVQGKLESVENVLETATMQGIEQFVGEFQPPATPDHDQA
ncbi:augmin complex subunit dgt4 [Scaptodrosophila lebanonensis]|uniref:Augmin complex subunit dgt4 n=1 Tax=Drosophila lebanonensis TaxID=7225 RepID=A0A6J2U2L1_DROLE|nr:augmin complex subunit dgt4 [Scaptodrosophila lebanonensis]